MEKRSLSQSRKRKLNTSPRLEYIIIIINYYLLQLSFHSMGVVITLVETKQIRMNIHKETIQKHSTHTIPNTVNTSAHLCNKNQQAALFYFQCISIINLYMFREGLLLLIRRHFSVPC